MKQKWYLLVITLIVMVGFSGAVAQDSGPGAETLPDSEEGNGASSSILLAVGAVLGFLARTFWDYCKLKLTRRAEVQKLSLEKLFEFARKYYFGIVFYTMSLARNIDAIQKRDADSTDHRDDPILKAFYNLTQYRREIAKFVAEDSGTWFLPRRASEEEVNKLDSDLEELLPFSRAEDSYLGYVASREDVSGADWKPIPFYLFQRHLEEDEGLRLYYTRFRDWIEQGGNSVSKFKESLDKLPEIIMDDLNIAFVGWYKSVQWWKRKQT